MTHYFYLSEKYYKFRTSNFDGIISFLFSYEIAQQILHSDRVGEPPDPSVAPCSAPGRQRSLGLLIAQKSLNTLSLAFSCSSSHSLRSRREESMAGQQDVSSWTDLLHSSTRLLEQAVPSAQFPPLQVCPILFPRECAPRNYQSKCFRISELGSSELPSQLRMITSYHRLARFDSFFVRRCYFCLRGT